ncbi:arabinose ABC transporter substrate-binding protein [Vibrio diazotrophicus]|uniref:arabinose ABC transporter substrate-binding protein n=1 Tax=Vibrio diazotrophicus TaxID=685 RepID=UPI000C9DE342|nr:arabinose ABC transporter substrate-binding protein [Vibrio diazotrophicus]PNH99040.1 sugar ABC transporter substrate-binding protein [Vibrio diazotrophicus]
MKKLYKNLGKVILVTSICSVSMNAAAEAKKKIGFIVKQPEAGWFQDEWKFAEIAAKEKGFELIKIGAQDGQKLMSALDNLGTQQADGVIVCVPNVKLGSAVVASAKRNGLKLMSVDDRLVDGNGDPIEDVVHMGISAYSIGREVGTALLGEIKARGWDPKDVGVMALTYKQLPTAFERTKGATDVLNESNYPSENIFEAPHRLDNTEQAFNAANSLITQKGQYKKWIVYGMNDQVVIGGVRALEGNGIKSGNIIGLGINGTEEAINEFRKPVETGFYGTIILSAKAHGYQTSINMYNWVANGIQPEKLVYTSGYLATRDNYEAVRKDLGL